MTGVARQRIRLIVDLREFGPLGDGSSINAALEEASVDGLAVNVPNVPGGFWETDETITLKYGASLVSDTGGSFEESGWVPGMPGPVIRLADGADCDLLVNDPAAPIRPGQDGLHRWQRSCIRGIKFDGNRAGQTRSDLAILRFTKAWSIYLDRVTANDAAGYCAFLDDCNPVNTLGCTFLGAEKSPVYFKDTADCTWDQVEIGGGFESACVFDNTLGLVVSGKIYNAGYASRPTLTMALSALGSEDEVLTSMTSAAYLPRSGRIRLGTEEISYTSWEAGRFIGCERGVNGTEQSAHSIGAAIRLASDHANNAHFINNSKLNMVHARLDQSFQSAVYLEEGSDSNQILGSAFLWGLYNLEGQPAIFCDSAYNTLALNLSRAGEADITVANQTTGLRRGPNAFRNIEMLNYDVGIPIKATGGFPYNQIGLSTFGDHSLPSNTLFGGRVALLSATNGVLQLRDQIDDPDHTAEYQTVYGKDGKLFWRDDSGVIKEIATN